MPNKPSGGTYVTEWVHVSHGPPYSIPMGSGHSDYPKTTSSGVEKVEVDEH